MQVAVAGGTGLTGSWVVTALAAAGHRPIVLSRSTGVDLTSAGGLDGALAGVDAVIDVTNISTTRSRVATTFFDTVTSNLLSAGERAGVRHHLVLSIIGIDRVDYGYYHGKLRQEELTRSGPLPWTVLRASPFHEFADNALHRLGGPVALVPQMRFEPVAVREVAEELVALLSGPPRGQAPELAGPQEEELVDMARRLLGARRSRRPVLPLWIPGAGARAMAAGAHRRTGPGPRGVQTFDQWLATAAAAAGSRS